MPNFLIQFFTFLRREIRLQLRLSRSLLLDQFLVLLAGGTLGALRKQVSQPEFIKFNKWGLELHLLLLACFVVLVVEILCVRVIQEVSFRNSNFFINSKLHRATYLTKEKIILVSVRQCVCCSNYRIYKFCQFSRLFSCQKYHKEGQPSKWSQDAFMTGEKAFIHFAHCLHSDWLKVYTLFTRKLKCDVISTGNKISFCTADVISTDNRVRFKCIS